jgi:two-component system, NarL family, nitrate/nitrite response regulator NarL
MAIRLVLADEYPLILFALATLFSPAEGFEIVASCTDGVEALKATRRHRPDVLIVDLRIPGLSGFDILRELSRDELPTHTVLLAGEIADRESQEAMRLNVGGVVLKDMPATSIVQCVRKVLAGEPWLERRSASRVLGKLMHRESGTKEAAAVLTPRELEIVRLIGRGLRNREIASRLSITEQTVKVHLSNVYGKLGVNGRLALLRYAEDRGFL